MRSLFAGHCAPFCVLLPTWGEHAGGFGFVALTGFAFETAWAAGSGASGPVGSPGDAGCANLKAAGCPSTVTESTVRLGPLTFVFVRSKSRLKSVRHFDARCVRSTRLPGRNTFVGAS